MNDAARCRAETIAALVAALIAGAVPAYAQQATNLGSVEAKALVGSQAGKKFDSKVLTAKEKLKATQPVKSVPKFIFELVSPAGGGMQALSTLPNVYISGYNVDNASARNTISMRGVKVGWNSMPGDLETNAITALFDGIPLNSLSKGTSWHSSETPIGALMSGINVVEGPGNPRDRWYDSLGGTINFVPVEPTRQSGGRVSLSGGSFSSEIVSGVFNTGDLDGWSTAMGGAAARSDSFRKVLGSNKLPSDSEQAYVKTRKRLASGSISFGAYYTRSDEWRPNMIPVTPVSTVAIAGSGAPGPLYSQQTSGFYSTLPRSLWWKHNEIVDDLVWSHLHLALSPSLELSNEAWFRVGKVRHYRINTYLGPTGSNDVEHYIERSKTFGDQLILDAKLASIDTLSFGGYVINARAVDTSDSSSTYDGSSLAQPDYIGYDDINSIDVAGFMQDEFRPIAALEIVPGVRLVDFITDFSNTSPTEACTVYPYMQDPTQPAGGTSVAPASNCAYGQPVPTFTDSHNNPYPWSANIRYDTNPSESTNLTATEPSLGVNYAVGGGVHLFGSYSITRHNPNAGNLDNYPVDLNTLKLARATTYDFGVRYLGLRVAGMRRVYAELEYFHTLLDNQTQSFSFANDPTTFFGYGSAALRGVDLVVQANIDRHWSAFGNFGYLRSQWNSFTFPGAASNLGTPNKPASYGTNIPVSNSPKDNANLGASYRFLLSFATLKTTLWDQYTGIRYLWNNDTRLPTSQSIPSYNLLNLSIRARILGSPIPGVTASEVSLQVLNLADTRYNSTEYISSGGYFNTSNGGYAIANPGSPRAIYLTVSADF
jgi:iron complex outermembrane receptor protein